MVLKVNEIMQILKEQGYKLTEQRKEIIETIFKQNRYVSAKEILNEVQDRFPGVSFDTIYRNLSILSDLDLLEETQFEGEAKYRVSCIEDHHHHLVCTKCGQTSVLPECPMDLLQGLAGDFRVTGHKFEIYGLCKECQQGKNT
ncbi:Fur family transcriptional regulator [Tepidibacillus decaturensis]|uniref:Fur family transcriptional regulator n=1 Tax=Tepidibacillus decaturensis TaxID=1413211 RepID=UPI002AA2A2BC|nr:Fur family transcriptional regulator [Tepidibacillus decaturensis]